MNMNKVLLIGYMTRNPELRYIPSGTPVVNFGLGINRTYVGQDGEQKKEVCFVEVNMFGKRGIAIEKHFVKGSPIFIEGRLQLNQWTADGEKHSVLRVVAEDFQFVSAKKTENVVDADRVMEEKPKATKAKKVKKPELAQV